MLLHGRKLATPDGRASSNTCTYVRLTIFVRSAQASSRLVFLCIMIPFPTLRGLAALNITALI
jgi:hypothetical protein